MNRLDMEPVMTLLKEAYHTAKQIDQKAWEDNTPHISSTEKAELSRHLNHLADQLLLAAALVRNEYWIGKGYKDSITTPVLDEGEQA